MTHNINETANSHSGAICYDFFEVNGGAETVTEELANLTNVPVYLGFVSPRYKYKYETTKPKIHNISFPVGYILKSLLGILSFYSSRGKLVRYKWVIYSGNNTLAASLRRNSGNILYCHTPPRFLYDLYGYYLERFPWLLRPIFWLYVKAFRRYYEYAIRNMSCVVANSSNTSSRLQYYLGVESIVVHPPTDIARFVWKRQDQFYLSSGRCEPLKRVDLIVKAFLRMPEKTLIVSSGGSQLDELKLLARGAKNIKFTGWISLDEMSDLIGRCIATIYIPVDEDFGMSPVESMAAGKPVIGVAEGGLKETMVNFETGILIDQHRLHVHSICDAVEYISPEVALSMRSACEERAREFSLETFTVKMQDIISVI
ncbi:MAG: glycosyltransferase [Halioglobus sp.]